MMKLVVYMGLIMAVSCMVYAAPTGLNIIPTADVLAPGEYVAEFENNANDTLTLSGSQSFLNTELGAFRGFELGYDQDLDQGSYFINFKWQFFRDKNANAVAFGIQNMGAGQHPEPYLVGSLSQKINRFHLGVIRATHKLRPMLGYERLVNRNLIVQADHVGGGDFASSLGLVWNFSSEFSVTAAYLIGNRPHSNSRFFTLTYTNLL